MRVPCSGVAGRMDVVMAVAGVFRSHNGVGIGIGNMLSGSSYFVHGSSGFRDECVKV